MTKRFLLLPLPRSTAVHVLKFEISFFLFIATSAVAITELLFSPLDASSLREFHLICKPQFRGNFFHLFCLKDLNTA